MAYLGDSSISSIVQHATTLEEREQKRRRELKERAKQVQAITEGAAGAALVGYVSGRYGDANGTFNVPRTTIPLDFALAGAGLFASFLGSDKGDHIFNLSVGALAGATNNYFRRHGAAAKAAGKFWAGEDDVGSAPEIVGTEIVGTEIVGQEEIVGSAPEIVGVTHNHPMYKRRRYQIGSEMSDADLAKALQTL